jgi:DNA-binding NtrC family response regulator
VVARRLHEWGGRADKPFVAVNCASLPQSLIESTLFGHERGAFTGADKRKIGTFEAADGGTLFLDEIGEMPLEMQAKLLRALELRAFTRVGGHEEVRVDVRVVCATHRDLRAEVARGRFREDLFYRVSVLVVKVPPLRERPRELALLATVFAKRFSNNRVQQIEPEAMEALRAHPWPGNVRELKNAIEHATVFAAGSVIALEHLPQTVRGGGIERTNETADIGRAAVEEALAAEGGNRSRAARRLGISRGALLYRLDKYGLK